MDFRNQVKNKNFQLITPLGSWLQVKVTQNKITVGTVCGFITEIVFMNKIFGFFFYRVLRTG